MQDKLLKQIEHTQKKMEQNQEWKSTYDKHASVLLESRNLLEEFSKNCKEYQHLQFYLAEISPTQGDLLAILAKFNGQNIARIRITKDGSSYITTNEFNESNKSLGCKLQLNDAEWNSKETKEFLDYFRGDIPIKTKGNERATIESMLLNEFAKTTSYDKLLTGIQPIKYSNALYFPIPIITSTKDEVQYINVLARTKVRRITVFELMDESQDPATVLADATAKAIFLTNLLHSKSGDKWFKLFGFHGRIPPHLTIKVCIATNKKLSSKCKEFAPFELRNGVDTLDYRYLYYENDPTKITNIITNVND